MDQFDARRRRPCRRGRPFEEGIPPDHAPRWPDACAIASVCGRPRRAAPLRGSRRRRGRRAAVRRRACRRCVRASRPTCAAQRSPIPRLPTRRARRTMNDDWLGSAIAAAQAGDEAAFGRIVERFRPELKVHCYRMLASLDDAEDTVQDVFLQAWRGLGDFEGRASVRTWLYRIATNACLAKRSRTRRRRRLLTQDAARGAVPIVMSVPWLQACPEDLIDRVAACEPDPASLLVARETIELAFIAALQHLPERQRAVLVLRDVIGWSVQRCAPELRLTPTSVNSPF